MNKDQKLLEEAYLTVKKNPKYFGKPEFKGYWRNYLGLHDFEVTANGSVRINGNFSYHGGPQEDAHTDMDRLPFNFESVSQDFLITNCKNLKSLEGSPQFVPGSFVCDACDLKTLRGAPRKVGTCFKCDTNELTSLEGAPDHVGTNFWAYGNPIISLEGAPEFVGGKIVLDNFSQEDYEKFRRDRRVDKKVSKELSKDFGDVDDVLKDF